MIFNYAPIIHPKEIEELTDLHWKEFEFTRFAQPNTYIKLDISLKAIIDLEEYIDEENRAQWGIENEYEADAHLEMICRLYNDRCLMRTLRRETNFKEKYVLVYIPEERG